MTEESNFHEIKVTVEVTYWVPKSADKKTVINGWTIEEVVDDWFNKHDINYNHATRDSYRLGSGMKVLKVEHD